MKHKILFVDDEKDILLSLQRLFIMEDDYEVFTAESGFKALELLKKETVDLIVSDQRMPEMEGVEFLKRSKEYSPDSIRIILTGYADINAAIDSINKGEVYKYITKPWDNDDINTIIHDALELRRLRKENERLLELTAKQNLELKDLNANLEKKVKDQTKDIQNMLDKLKDLYVKLDSSFINTVKILSSIIKLKEKSTSLSERYAPALSKILGYKLKLSELEMKDLKIAVLLHDLGLIGINSNLLNKPFVNMTSKERIEFMKHPILGQAVLQSVGNMQKVGIIIKYHHEYWDGRGYPGNLSGLQIPLTSRILAIVNDYDDLLNGLIMNSKLTNHEVKQFIIENSGQIYDPDIVSIFAAIIDKFIKSEEEKKSKFRVMSAELKTGMVLSVDIYTTRGLLLLNEGTVINKDHIKKILNFEKTELKKYEIYVTSNPR